MATQLELGITAIRQGNTDEAKTLLTQVLKENNRNEQAWLWLSETVDTVGEQISCIEQVLLINPDNKTAKLALQKLKSQPPQRLAAGKKSNPALLKGATTPASNRENDTRKPFRLSDRPAPPAVNDQIHREATVPLAPISASSDNHTYREHNDALLRQASAVTQNLPVTKRSLDTLPLAKSTDPDNFPLLPVILFGTLSVTAVGGLIMIILLLFFN